MSCPRGELLRTKIWFGTSLPMEVDCMYTVTIGSNMAISELQMNLKLDEDGEEQQRDITVRLIAPNACKRYLTNDNNAST